MNKFYKNTLFLLLIIFLLSFACKQDQKQAEINEEFVVDTAENNEDRLNDAKEIFYSLPAPHEVASFLLQNDSLNFDAQILNNEENVLNYVSETAQAFNFGIYTVDVCYANYFQRQQFVRNYMGICSNLSNALGIANAFDKNVIDLLEENMDNRDEIIKIISSSFMQADSYLQDNDRIDIASMILLGGWIEGLYIGIKLSENDPLKNAPLTSSILEQSIPLELILMFLNNLNTSKNTELDKIKTQLTELQELYESTNTNVTINGYLSTDKDSFSTICNKFIDIRTNLIKLM